MKPITSGQQHAVARLAALYKVNGLWLVGQVLDDEGAAWEFQGIFPTEALAVKACRSWNYFVMPCTLGKPLAHETIDPATLGAYYPIKRGAE